jgi:alpha-glucosidase (family GH31 glycosyl hydrolase)
VTAGLSASACGILYWGWDLAGFSGPVPDAELYLRAAWASAFMPVMQYHAEFNHHREPKRDRTPWWVAEVNDAPFVVDEFRAAVEERELLVPQWMLASEFLVCPVLAPGAETLDVYLPDPGAGREWRDRWTGEAMTPGRHAVDVRTDGPRGWRCPVFRRTPAE